MRRGVGERRSAEAVEVRPAAALELGQLGEGVLEVAAALLEVGAALVDLAEHVLQLAGLAARPVVEVDDRADLLEREAEPLAAQDERQPGAVAAVVDAGRCRAARG